LHGEKSAALGGANTAIVVTHHDAVNKAAWMRPSSCLETLTCHTDARSQYTSISHTDRLSDFDIDPSIGTVGDSYDNAMAESIFALFKTELFRNPAVLKEYGGPWKGLDD
jgi:transposase InsO family protein